MKWNGCDTWLSAATIDAAVASAALNLKLTENWSPLCVHSILCMNVYFTLIAHFFILIFPFCLVCYRWSVIFYSLVQFIHIPRDLLASAQERILADQWFRSYYMTMQIDKCSSENEGNPEKRRCKQLHSHAHTQCNYFHSFSFHFHYYVICSHHTNFLSSLDYIIVMYNFSRKESKKSFRRLSLRKIGSEGATKSTVVVIAKRVLRMLNTSSHERYRHR